MSYCDCSPGTYADGWREVRGPVCAAREREAWRSLWGVLPVSVRLDDRNGTYGPIRGARGSVDLHREQVGHDRAVWEAGFRAGVRADQAANLGDHHGYLRASSCPYGE